MTTRIDRRFAALKQEGRAALMTFVMRTVVSRRRQVARPFTLAAARKLALDLACHLALYSDKYSEQRQPMGWQRYRNGKNSE